MVLDAELVESLNKATSSCISCGFCESVCPTLPAAGYDLSKGARGRVLLGKELYSDLSKHGKTNIRVADSFYSCLDCFACVQVCPAGVNAGEVSDIAKKLITQEDSPLKNQQKKVAKLIVRTTKKYGNPLGLRRGSAKWAKGLSFEENSANLLYTGNMYQLMAHSQSLAKLKSRAGEKFSDFGASVLLWLPQFMKLSGLTSERRTAEEMESALRHIHTLLTRSDITFSYLGEKEPYPGTFLFDLGYEKDFAHYAQQVTELFRKNGVERIITTDPHTYNLLKTQYPRYVEGFDFEVVYYLDLLDGEIFRESEERVTYHEPCYFTLREPTYRKPEELLRMTSEVSLPRRSGKSDFCCGGPSELLYPDLAEHVSNSRRMQLGMDKGEKVVTACPICFANLDKGSGATDIANHLYSRLKL